MRTGIHFKRIIDVGKRCTLIYQLPRDDREPFGAHVVVSTLVRFDLCRESAMDAGECNECRENFNGELTMFVRHSHKYKSICKTIKRIHMSLRYFRV